MMSWWLRSYNQYVVAIALLWVTSMTASAYSLPASQYNALYDLFNSTDGAHWTWNQAYSVFGYPWVFQTPNQNPCSSSQPWQGITCNSNCGKQQCYVTSLSLAKYSLHGTLPASISQLTTLTDFYVSYNNLTGTIPPVFGNLTNLEYFLVDNNQFTGTIPDSLGNLTRMLQMSFHHNHFSGTLPASLGNLNVMSYFDVYINHLTGTIPSSFGNMGMMEYLNLQMNQFTGTIPSSLGNLSALQNLYLDSNQLTGPIPFSFGDLVLLLNLAMNDNMLTGTIPPSLGNLDRMVSIFVTKNLLSGTIPSSLGNWSVLDTMQFSDNLLSGTIPASLGNLSLATFIALSFNELTGTIPSSLGNLIIMQEIGIMFNKLTGTIPSSFGHLSTLTTINVNNNRLSGTLPESFDQLDKLEFLDFQFNQFSGTISSSLLNLPNLAVVYFYDNCFTGNMPQSLNKNSKLGEVDLNHNFLSGNIPSWMFKLGELDISYNGFTGVIPNITSNGVVLQELVLSYNFLTSTIPVSLQHAKVLSLLYLNNNLLTGTIPLKLVANLPLLKQFYAQSNYFTGTLASNTTLPQLEILYLYNNSLWGTWFEQQSGIPLLQSLDISNNMLSGSIQKDWFANMAQLESLNLNSNQLTGPLVDSMFTGSSNLSSVVLASNCFTGTLPSSICNSPVLTQVIMDGLHSATSCIQSAIPWLSDSGVITTTAVHGTIPACLLALPSLTTLHLGGNALTGTLLPGPISNVLQYLTLSSNELTGTVSDYIWKSNITSLDLSFNRLQGTLPSTILPAITQSSLIVNSTIYLNNNRFSGVVPSSVLPLTGVNVLEGNIFSCNIERNNIPSHDPKYNSYACGSDTTNIALIIFAACCLILVLFIGCRYVGPTKAVFSQKVEELSSVLLLSNTSKTIAAILNGIMGYCLRITLLCLSVGMILYGWLSIYHSTYTDSFVWTVSAIYKSGVSSSVLMLLWLLGILALAQHLSTKWYPKPLEPSTSSPTATSWKLHAYCKFHLVTVLVIVMNVIFITTINGLYVYAIRSNISFLQRIACALFLSTIKVVMNNVSIRLAPHVGHHALIGICLFNNVVAPFLAEMFVSSDCFLYIVSKQSALTFVFDVYSCPVVSVDGLQLPCNFNIAVNNGFNTVTELSISPAYHYSYQCSSSLLSGYVYIFILRYVLSGIVTPCLFLVLRHLIAHQRMRTWMIRWLPMLWRDWDTFIEQAERVIDNVNALQQYTNTYLAPHFVVNMVSDLSILVCFGVLFPPLTLVILVSVWKDVMIVRWTESRIHRLKEQFRNHAIINENIVDLISLMDLKYKAAAVDIYYGVKWGLCITSVIWAFVLFETLSAAEGVMNSRWIAVVTLIAPSLLWMGTSTIKNKTLCRKQDIEETSTANTNLLITDVKNPVIFGTDEKDPSIRDMNIKRLYDANNDNETL